MYQEEERRCQTSVLKWSISSSGWQVGPRPHGGVGRPHLEVPSPPRCVSYPRDVYQCFLFSILPYLAHWSTCLWWDFWKWNLVGCSLYCPLHVYQNWAQLATCGPSADGPLVAEQAQFLCGSIFPSVHHCCRFRISIGGNWGVDQPPTLCSKCVLVTKIR